VAIVQTAVNLIITGMRTQNLTMLGYYNSTNLTGKISASQRYIIFRRTVFPASVSRML